MPLTRPSPPIRKSTMSGLRREPSPVPLGADPDWRVDSNPTNPATAVANAAPVPAETSCVGSSVSTASVPPAGCAISTIEKTIAMITSAPSSTPSTTPLNVVPDDLVGDVRRPWRLGDLPLDQRRRAPHVGGRFVADDVARRRGRLVLVVAVPDLVVPAVRAVHDVVQSTPQHHG